MPSKGIKILRKITRIIAYFLLVIGMIAIILQITKCINNSPNTFVLDSEFVIGIIYVLFTSFLGFVFAEALKKEYVFIMPKPLRLFAKIIFLLGLILLVLRIREVKHIIGGLFIVFIGFHFMMFKDVE